MKKSKLPKGYEWAHPRDLIAPNYKQFIFGKWHLVHNDRVVGLDVGFVQGFGIRFAKPIISPLQREFNRTTMASRMLRAFTPNNYSTVMLSSWIRFIADFRNAAIKLAIQELESK